MNFVLYEKDYQRIPAKIWTDFSTIEEGAINQIIHLCNLPFAYHHVAIMPDVHSGYGMPIGGVLATEGVVIPNCVGVDIGCGMHAVRTGFTEIPIDVLKKIMRAIREKIPVGRNHHEKPQDVQLPLLIGNEKVVLEQYRSLAFQIGTLGTGNHFIEIQKGSDGYIWFMIHSGSRNLGKKVADYYNNIAKQLNERWYSSVPKEWDLAFLPIESTGTSESRAYLLEMDYCVEFALTNRKRMSDRIIQSFFEILPHSEFYEEYDVAHNYAVWENHFGKNVIVHRKGATLAREGIIGIIPGSQGTKSYIVKGLGNPESFMSCSHGSGRLMSRTDAKKKLNLKEEQAKLDSQGIIHSIRYEDDLDEASGAYKSIDQVMENQKDLVEIVVELTPLGVIKG